MLCTLLFIPSENLFLKRSPWSQGAFLFLSIFFSVFSSGDWKTDSLQVDDSPGEDLRSRSRLEYRSLWPQYQNMLKLKTLKVEPQTISKLTGSSPPIRSVDQRREIDVPGATSSALYYSLFYHFPLHR